MPRQRALKIVVKAVAASMFTAFPRTARAQTPDCGRGGWFACGTDCCPPDTTCCQPGDNTKGGTFIHGATAVCCAFSDHCYTFAPDSSSRAGDKACCGDTGGTIHVCTRRDGFEECCAIEYPCCNSDPVGCCANPSTVCDPVDGCVFSRPCNPPCTGLQICCDGTCVSLLTDPSHCRTCGTVCPDGQICCGGNCQTCNPPLMCCDPLFPNCIDTSTNPDHCGTCGNVCPPGQVCKDGACVGCTTSLDCDPTCETCDTETNTCVSQCANGGTCCRGVCCCGDCDQTTGVCVGPSNGICEDTGDGEFCCGSQCKKLKIDNSNCGACGHLCFFPETCCNGECMNLDSDPSHCGRCDGTGQCPPDAAACCRGMCVNPSAFDMDTANCGECLNNCPEEAPICRGGQCVSM
jgi:hypothetical protein